MYPFSGKEEPLLKNPNILQLSDLGNDYTDYEFNVSDIAYYYIIPADELAAKQIKFKTDVAGDELVLVIIFKDGSYKGFSLARHSMSFLY
jgi:hypothetical protein